MNTLTRIERLRSKSDIQRLFDEGRGGFVYPFRYRFVTGENQMSVLFSVPKKNHKRAHDRNLLRRRTREAYRCNKKEGLTGQMVLIYSVKEIVPYQIIEESVKEILHEIVG